MICHDPIKKRSAWFHYAGLRCDFRKMWSLKTSACRAVLLVTSPVFIAGCGSHMRALAGQTRLVEPNGTIKSVKRYTVKYLPNGFRRLAREKLPGGYVSIIAERYEYQSKIYSELASIAEKPGGHEHGTSSGGSGPSLEQDEPGLGPVNVNVYYGCAGEYPYVLVYGLLHNSQDTVTARERGITVKLKKVEIPSSFHPDGVLVYTLLGNAPTDITTSTSDGRVVHVDHYAEGGAVCQLRRPG